MKTQFLRLLLPFMLTAGLLCSSGSIRAAAKKKGAGPAPGERGAITAVSTGTPASITVGGKEIQVDNNTTVTLDGRPVKLKDVKPGMFAQVSTFTFADKLTAVSIRASIQQPADPTPGKKKKKKSN